MKKNVYGVIILTVTIIAASCTGNMANVRDTALANNFSDRIVEKGNDSDHSLVRLTLKRNKGNSLIVTAEAWGVSETGPFIRVQREGSALVFTTLAHCGTIELSTPVKVRETCVLHADEERRIMTIQFKHNNQVIAIEK